MNNRAGDVQSQLVETTEQVQESEEKHHQLAEVYSRHQARLQTLENQIAQSRVENEKRRQHFLEATRQATQLLSEVENLELKKEQVVSEEKLTRSRMSDLETELQKHRQELRVSELDEQRMVNELDEQAVILEAAEREVSEGRRLLSRRRDELAVQKGRRSAVRERISVLAELEQKQEGLATGVKYVLQQVEEGQEAGFSAGCGLVADLLQASLEMAPLIDIALGSVAQHVVLSDSQLIERLAAGQVTVPGRVGFVALDQLPPAAGSVAVDLGAVTGVVGRLDRMVQTEAMYQGLAEHLLGTTWLVKTLKDARRIRRDTGAAARFVTVAGELIDSQGAIVVGPREVVVGLVSRRSELRELNREAEVLQTTIVAAVEELRRTEENIEQQERAIRRLTDKGRTLNGGLTDCRVRLRTQAHVVAEKGNELVQLGEAVQVVMSQQEQVKRQQLRDRRGVLEETDARLAQTRETIETEGRRLSLEEGQRSEVAAAATAARVELATGEQQLMTLQSRQVQFQEDHRERSQAIGEAQEQLSLSLVRLGECRRAMLGATTDLAELYLRKDFFVEQVVDEKRERTDILSLREELGKRGKQCRELLHRVEEKQHKQELAAGEFRLQRKSLAERLAEDYQIDITTAADDATTPEASDERTEIEEEIVNLRQKLNNIGAVNMEALEELEELEARFTTLSTQYNDLIDAKEVLARIITRINADSRRLFVETMEAIRVNFQLLYRKAFGGGTADLVLEEGQDVLEAGVEIVTTPPGKPSFNNSLLSGGEKALTAVSLLLAIFQFRPSPFCVLDEVDAPFDEANIDRFVGVLKEFLGWTKFVIVTHSKKTMTAADTLYGVTMQESGVSKRVSVRFEDVSEEGEIDPEVVQQQQASDSTASNANQDEEDPGQNVAAG